MTKYFLFSRMDGIITDVVDYQQQKFEVYGDNGEPDGLAWHETDNDDVAPGWVYDNEKGVLSAPPPPPEKTEAELIIEQIEALEAQQTPRRMREAFMDSNSESADFIRSIDAQINTLRERLYNVESNQNTN